MFHLVYDYTEGYAVILWLILSQILWNQDPLSLEIQYLPQLILINFLIPIAMTVNQGPSPVSQHRWP